MMLPVLHLDPPIEPAARAVRAVAVLADLKVQGRNRAGAPYPAPMIVPLPAVFITPCLPSKATQPPSGSDWVHEIKHDGYRLMLCRDGSGSAASPRTAMTGPTASLPSSSRAAGYGAIVPDRRRGGDLERRRHLGLQRAAQPWQ